MLSPFHTSLEILANDYKTWCHLWKVTLHTYSPLLYSLTCQLNTLLAVAPLLPWCYFAQWALLFFHLDESLFLFRALNWYWSICFIVISEDFPIIPHFLFLSLGTAAASCGILHFHGFYSVNRSIFAYALHLHIRRVFCSFQLSFEPFSSSSGKFYSITITYYAQCQQACIHFPLRNWSSNFSCISLPFPLCEDACNKESVSERNCRDRGGIM